MTDAERLRAERNLLLDQLESLHQELFRPETTLESMKQQATQALSIFHTRKTALHEQQRAAVACGEWRPTTTAKEFGLVGFHLPAMVSTFFAYCSGVSTCSSSISSCTSPQVPRVLTLVSTRFRSPTPIASCCISPRP